MIGLFDSGSGGLSVLAALRAKAPDADIAYFGDIANAPYGIKSQQKLEALTGKGVDILKEMGATEIVSACNSVSPSILAGAAGNMPVIEMTRPTALGMQAYKRARVLLIATPATVDSKIYKNALHGIVELDSLAIPELAGAIEFGADDQDIADIVHKAFNTKKENTYEHLLLGCTHYPLVRQIIEKEAQHAFGVIACIDPAGFVAGEIVRCFDTSGKGRIAFRISKDSDTFRLRIAALFPDADYAIEVV